MEEKSKSLYIKRTQRDYPMSFKLAVVREVESGAITNNGAMRKYGIQGHGTIVEWRRKFGNFEVGNTVGIAGAFACCRKCRQKHCCQNGDDGDDHEQFDQGEFLFFHIYPPLKY